MHFPTFNSLPDDSDIDLRYYGEEHYGVYGPVKHWCLLVEIVKLIPYFRPMFTAKDKAGKEFLVAMYLDNDVALPDFWNKYCKPGNVVAIMYACSHSFMDGQMGIRVEDVENIKVFCKRCCVSRTTFFLLIMKYFRCSHAALILSSVSVTSSNCSTVLR